MPYEITDVRRSGFYEAFCDGARINRDGHSGNHTTENEAEQTIFWHASNSASEGDRVYEIQPAKSVFEVRVVGSVASQTGDTEAPTQPGSLTANVISATQINYTWTASTDNVGVAGYQVFVDGIPQTPTTDTNFSLQSLTPDTQYSVEVSAFDAAGNNSPNAGPALATTNSNSAPVWSLGNQSGETGGAINIDLDSVCTDSDGDTITYSLLSGTLPAGLALSGTRNETLSGTLSEADVDNFTLQASDGITTTDVAVTFTVTAPDTVPPAVPTGLAAGTTGQSTVPLTWDANGEGDLNFYSIYRSTDDVNFGKVTTDGAQTTTSFTDTGRSANTTYYYTVTATDDSGNESAQSASVQATTQDFVANSNSARIATALASYTIPFSYNAPADPVTTDTINVAAGDSAGLNTALATSARTINIPAGTYNGVNLGNIASNVDVIADNGAQINASAFTTNNNAFRWTGGVIDLGAGDYNNNASDVMWNNVRFDNVQNFQPGFGGNASRFALINCTVDATGAVYFTQGGSGGIIFSDHVIVANDFQSGSSGFAMRMQRMERGIWVGNRLKNDGFQHLRVHYNSNNIYWGGNTLTGAGNGLNVARNGSGPGTSVDNLGNIWVVGNVNWTNSSPQTEFNRLGFSGEGPQVWEDNIAYVDGISQSFVDETIRWPQPINAGDVSNNNTRAPFGAGPPTDFSDWLTDFSNGADH